MMSILKLLIVFASTLAAANAQARKLQDADYVKIFCNQVKGETQVTRGNSRADCVTEQLACEVDFAKDWKANIQQTKRYGAAFNKKPCLALVVENDLEENIYDHAQKQISKEHPEIILFKLENRLSKQESLALIDGPIVKMSNRKICHIKDVGAYGDTTHFTSYSSIKDCLEAGGILPSNVGKKTLFKAEQEAINAQLQTQSGGPS